VHGDHAESGSAPTPSPRREALRANLPRGSETILVLDDEPLVLKVNANELRKLGYQVRCAASGEEALAYLQEHHVDLVLLDLLMPGLNGVETYQRMLRYNPRQKAIVYSGYAQPSMVAEAQQLGADPILIKPTPLNVLARAVRDKLDHE